jgi:hypothetical protein
VPETASWYHQLHQSTFQDWWVSNRAGNEIFLGQAGWELIFDGMRGRLERILTRLIVEPRGEESRCGAIA